ncbi:UNVERIFIED_CONTAM: hypothetical protein Q9R71_21655 [Actinomycetes bacterium ARC8]|nr:hypothetical protein [Actinomycetes bacterium ARC8]
MPSSAGQDGLGGLEVSAHEDGPDVHTVSAQRADAVREPSS